MSLLSPKQISDFHMPRDFQSFIKIEIDRFDQPMTRTLTEFLLRRYGSDYWKVIDISGNGQLDAYIIAGVERDTALHIYSFAIRREFEGNGWAKQLLKHVIELATLDKLKKITLEVQEKNHRAIGLYRHLGFEIVGKETDYYEENIHALIMELRI